MELEAAILQRLTPTESEQSAMADARHSLETAATEKLRASGIDGSAQVQGSVAKDTWIAGSADMDCFLLLSPETPEDQLESIVSDVAEAVLSAPQKKYAQHPYLIGTRDGFQVDLVPAFRIDTPEQRLSAVDRTPLHTAWVQTNLSDVARDNVRLAKQWCKGVGAYGAETRIGGFSGYLIEVLIHQFSDFHGFLSWCAEGCKPRRIAVGEDQVDDEVSPLIVVDPVDPGRNCAAAVTNTTLARIQDAALAYQEAPTESFFFPAPASMASAEELQQAMEHQGTTWIGAILHPKTDRLDMVFPQFQRATRVASEGLERAGFSVHRVAATPFDNDQSVGLQWLVSDTTLPAERMHQGPRADKEPNSEKFREKWANHADAAGPIAIDERGFLQLPLHVRERTPAQWLDANHTQVLTGKHVVAAIAGELQVLTAPHAVPAEWAPTVSELVLDQRPWLRQ